jgi:hypothetical protein
MKNLPRRSIIISGGVLLLGLITFFVPALIGWDGTEAGVALSALGIFVAILGVIAILLSTRLARALENVVKEENILAHWKYTPQEWQSYADQEHRDDKEDRKGIFILVSVIAIVAGLALWLIVRNGALAIILIVLGIIAVAGLSTLLSAQAAFRQNKKEQGEVIISLDGVYVNRQTHIWKGIGTRLESATFEDRVKGSPRLVFEYSAASRGGRDFYTARVPVPLGQEARAKKILEEVSAKHLYARKE